MKWKSVVFVLILFMKFGLSAETRTFHFDHSRLTFQQYKNFDIVRYKDFDNLQKIGKPALPFDLYQYELPAGLKLDSIAITIQKSDTLEGDYNILPGDKQYILSQKDIQPSLAKSSTYSSQTPFPDKAAQYLSSGNLAGIRIASIQLFPLIYHPAQKKLELIQELEIKLFHSSDGNLSKASSKPINSDLIRNLKHMDLNKSSLSKVQTSFTPDQYYYVIITSQELVDDFRPLAEWKTQKGMKSRIVTIDSIEANYQGEDLPAKIRNFIKYARDNWSTYWLLLGGDTNIVPPRYAFAFDSEANGPPDANDIPCDLYYADLDGSWDDDQDGIYGEVEDNIDMYPEVMVGRAPVENSQEAQAWISKLLKYIKNPDRDKTLNMLFLAMILWHDPYTDSSIGKDYIDSVYIPDRFDPIQKLYESEGNGTVEQSIDAINQGVNIINHDGHAWYTTMGVGAGEYLTIEDMDNLTNETIHPILYSIGCWPAAFDRDCIAEHFLTNPDGGGVAFVGNSRYGWGSPGNPLFGYSDRFDRAFFKELIEDKNPITGFAFYFAKSKYVPFSRQENVYRWCQYELNLLGDPEMAVWIDTPKEFDISISQPFSYGKNETKITVTRNDKALRSVAVCLMQENGIYERGYTSSDGQVEFDFEIDQIDSVIMTVTDKGYIPLQKKYPISVSKPYIKVDSLIYPDLASEEILEQKSNLDLIIQNVSEENATSVQGKITSLSSNFQIIDSTYSITNLQPGKSMVIEDSISFILTKFPEDDENFILQHSWRISDQEKGQEKLVIQANISQPRYSYYYLTYNEEKYKPIINVVIYNNKEFNGYFTLRSLSDQLTILDTTKSLNYLEPFKLDTSSFEIQIDENIELPAFPEIMITFYQPDVPSIKDTFNLELGDFGFFDDMEEGTENWTIRGEADVWHLSDRRALSGQYSWHAGKTSGNGYKPNLDSNYLETKPITVAEGAALSFLAWYEFPNYGTDGMYVQINADNKWKTLDFIGSGGALGTLPTRSDWIRYYYKLEDHLDPGEVTRVRFIMQSDEADSTEGIYIDNVQIYGAPYQNIIDEIKKPEEFKLHANYPNPFNISTNFPFELPESSDITIEIYNLKGEKIDTIKKTNLPSGYHTITWRASDLSSGIYFYRIIAGDKSKIGKCALLK